ncbi:unnamed protein product [Protopolystoma xenopodis]|uniref:Uncharacterized protein n=1 Tax=Protopolystoma xenopodis TaxID=117903 RepID=A0A3S5A005_9PLAT|nr:unnamed protein product [Protopolystoma xenopodis]
MSYCCSQIDYLQAPSTSRSLNRSQQAAEAALTLPSEVVSYNSPELCKTVRDYLKSRLKEQTGQLSNLLASEDQFSDLGLARLLVHLSGRVTKLSDLLDVKSGLRFLWLRPIWITNLSTTSALSSYLNDLLLSRDSERIQAALFLETLAREITNSSLSLNNKSSENLNLSCKDLDILEPLSVTRLKILARKCNFPPERAMHLVRLAISGRLKTDYK